MLYLLFSSKVERTIYIIYTNIAIKAIQRVYLYIAIYVINLIRVEMGIRKDTKCFTLQMLNYVRY